ncbi:MAG: phenylalanine--tRNA ligase subunit alpha [Candidatus Bathyarchaeota archaeon]|nr:phenylalanine--tRNA ligase subunit alpha [Candidatus Bathyarchaeota archaeon]
MVDLRENEVRILTALAELGGKVSVEQLMAKCELSDAAVMRSALILQENNLAQIHANPQTKLKLTSEGTLHAQNGLPERRIIKAVLESGGNATLEQAAEKVGLEQQFAKIALGWTQRKKWATFDSKTSTLQVTVDPEEGTDEKLLKLLCSQEETDLNQLDPAMQSAVEALKKRKALTVEEKTQRTLEITSEGKTALETGAINLAAGQKEITQLTPELIIKGEWKNAKFQTYNIQAPVARIWPGKKHPYLSFLDEVREKLVQLGFNEMVGTSVELSFFNFDALYTPQDHPARELDGIYRIKQPEHGDISAYTEAVQRVKQTHENGGDTGSIGWGSTYTTQEAQRLILRGHGTCLSARTLLTKNPKIPSKHFSIARVYRPEVVDKTHLSEFNQVEGIVIDENLTLKDLLGVLGKFAKEIAGADKIRFRPDYFPFTEPSVELSAYKKGYGWIEFGGSGIFRPEVTQPLGIKTPVIAWGLGVDRLFMMRAGVEDIRSIFSQDLDWLRKKQVA